MSGNIITLDQNAIHTELKDLVKNSVEETLNAMLDAEADRLVNAERYARDEERKGYIVPVITTVHSLLPPERSILRCQN